MAGMDKLFGTVAQYNELKEWLKKNKKSYLDYLRPLRDQEPDEDKEVVIGNFGGKPMKWLAENCSIEWVKEQALDKMGMFEVFFGTKY